MAQLHHLPNLAAAPRAKISAICDVSHELATGVARKYGLPPGAVAKTAPDLMARDLQAVVITNRNHGPLVRQALEAGLHVFVEKPVCWGLDEAHALAALERRTRPAVVGYMKRYDPAFARMADLDERPILVRLHVFAGARHRHEKLYPRVKASGVTRSAAEAENAAIECLIAASPTTREADRVGAVRTLAELAIHDLNLARALVGPLMLESARRFRTPFGPGFLVLMSANGTPVNVEIVPDFQTARDWDETLTAYLPGSAIELRFGSPFLRSAPTVIREDYAEGTDIVEREIVVSRDSPYRRELEHFLDCVAGLAESRTPIGDAVADLALVYEIAGRLTDL